MKRTGIALAAALVLAAPAAAQDPRWTLRGRGLWADYRSHSAYGTVSGTSTLDVEGGTGAEAAVELRATQRVGLELSLGRLTLDTDQRSYRQQFDPSTNTAPFVLVGRAESELVVQPLALALLFHPSPGGRLDWYLGPQLAWYRYDLDQSRLPARESEAGWGAKAGVEAPLGASGWAAGLELRYTEALYEEQERDLHDNLGMASAALGVSYHFPR